MGIAEAERLELVCVLECSDRSESHYLHIQRAGTWYGIRVACHEPHYQSSADYEQLLVAGDLTDDLFQRAAQFLVRSVREGGRIVADPAEVTAYIEREKVRVRTSGPTPFLTAQEQSQIRHRLNAIAAWSFEEAAKQ